MEIVIVMKIVGRKRRNKRRKNKRRNVHNWKNNKYALTNTYREINLDNLNKQSWTQFQCTIKIYGYNTYLINSSEEQQDGSAVLIRQHLKHKITDDYDTDFIQASLYTSLEPINIASAYLPPRRPYFPFTDFHRIASQNYSTYITGDLNATHPCLNYNRTKQNNVGKDLN